MKTNTTTTGAALRKVANIWRENEERVTNALIIGGALTAFYILLVFADAMR